MIEYKHFIYLDMYKTGSTHVAYLLKQITNEKPVRLKRHAPLTKGRPFTWKGGKLVFTTVRNPWDWYVSMWSYGHTVENPLYKHIGAAHGQDMLNRFYDMDNPKTAFPLWLKSMHDPDFLRQTLKGRRLPSSGLMDFLGFYTYRFLRVTLPYPELFLRSPFIRSMDGAISFHKRFAMYDTVMKSEELDASFADFAREKGRKLGFRDDAADTIEALSANHKNVSTRTLSSYRDYYTPDLVELVARRDRFFVDLFGYSF